MKINWENVILSMIFDILAGGLIYAGIKMLNENKFLAIFYFLFAIRFSIRSYLLDEKKESK